MRKCSAYIFFTLYLFSTTEAAQLSKFPVILEHFHEHQKENPRISFLAFLDMHYMHGSPRDADYDRDMQLPFKKATHHMLASAVHINTPAQVSLPAIFPVVHADFITTDDHAVYSTYLSAIFQPPRA